MRVLLTGGGTGGHTFPLIAVSRQIKQLNKQAELYYLGADDFSRQAFKQEPIEARFILSAKLRRYFSLKTLLDLIKLPLSFSQALFWLYLIMPDVIFSKGGPGSLMVVIAGWFYRIPVIIHESDTVSGLSNRLAGHFAKRVALAFEKPVASFAQGKILITGNPLRENLLAGNKQEAQEIFQLVPNKPVLLVVGGSQGAQFLNKIVLPILPELLKKYQIIHACGSANYEKYKTSLRGGVLLRHSVQASRATKQSRGDTVARVFKKPINLTNYHLHAFLDEKQMSLAYTAADLILARSGAGSIFEIAAKGKPSILVPLPDSAGDHQRVNAYEYAKTGAALVLEEPNLTEHVLAQRISALLNDSGVLSQMSQAALQFAKPNADKIIAQEIIELAS